MNRVVLPAVTLGVMAIGIAHAVADSPSAKLTLIPKGAMQKAGGYMPQRLMLSAEKPTGIKSEPTYSYKPLYGTLKFGPAADNGIVLALDEAPDASVGKLYADANGDGDLANDPSASWTRSARKVKNPQTMAETEVVMFNGAIEVQPKGEPASSVPYSVAFYRFAPETAKSRNLPTDMLLYYRDYGREGKLELGGKAYSILLLDEFASGRFDKTAHGEKEPAGVSLLIDRDGNGKFGQGERYDPSKPFNIGGTTYEVEKIAVDGSLIQLKVSDKKVAEIPLPADLSPGKPAIAFSRPTLDGKSVNFPKDYEGRLVLLDFWATWCGPCRVEIPGLVKAYEKNKGRGLAILGISLDQENQAEKVKAFLVENKMPWPQVYDGKFWNAEVAKMYSVNGIPAAYLVDGSTGKIIASGNSLRGEALDKTLTEALDKLGATK